MEEKFKDRIILASSSATRLELLKSAGLNVEACPAHLDEAALRDPARRAGRSGGDLALMLAHGKARACIAASGVNKSHIVIAADQILTCAGRQIDKAADRNELRETLRFLRGRTHQLQTATVVYCGESRVWSHLATPSLTMRDFSDAFLEDYLTLEGDQLLSCVGGYRYEARGVQLFSEVDGQNDAILGLPLLPLLAVLRDYGVLTS